MRVSLTGLLFALLLVVPAQAFSATGGTPEQRAWAWEVMRASDLHMQTIDAEIGIEVIFAEHWDPYWEVAPLPMTVGLAYLNGKVVVDSTYEMGFGTFGSEILTHEYSHLDWFTMDRHKRQDWGDMIGGDAGDWYHNRAESYAEHARVYSWTDEYYVTAGIRSKLPQLTREEWLDWRYGTPELFPDVDRTDEELWEAARWAKDNGIIQGYEDGTLGPYDTLLRRHVSLIVERTGGDSGWSSYAPATRGEVRDAIPGLEWLEARWDETLERSQLLRLLWRAR